MRRRAIFLAFDHLMVALIARLDAIAAWANREDDDD